MSPTNSASVVGDVLVEVVVPSSCPCYDYVLKPVWSMPDYGPGFIELQLVPVSQVQVTTHPYSRFLVSSVYSRVTYDSALLDAKVWPKSPAFLVLWRQPPHFRCFHKH
jgi:hypothetical protein